MGRYIIYIYTGLERNTIHCLAYTLYLSTHNNDLCSLLKASKSREVQQVRVSHYKRYLYRKESYSSRLCAVIYTMTKKRHNPSLPDEYGVFNFKHKTGIL